MSSLTVKDLLELKGVRQIAFAQVARESDAIAASEVGMDMIGTGCRAETKQFALLVPDTHFQFGLPWGQHATAEAVLLTAMQAMEAGELTEAEAEDEFDYNAELEQCVCFYQNVLDGGGADFISYLQKVDITQMDDDYSY